MAKNQTVRSKQQSTPLALSHPLKILTPSVHHPRISTSTVEQQSPMLSRLTEGGWEHPCPQKRYKRRRRKSKGLRKLLKSLPHLPYHIEPTQQACLPQVYRSLRYTDSRVGNHPARQVRLQSQNPRCLHDYRQDRTRILQTHLRLRRTTPLLRNNNLLKVHISIRELWDGSGKPVSLCLALASVGGKEGREARRLRIHGVKSPTRIHPQRPAHL